MRQFWGQLVAADRVMNQFRAHFIGKTSFVHFVWGAMDLASTQFSGRPAPTHPGGAPNCPDWVMVEWYSHELASGGFWPGTANTKLTMHTVEGSHQTCAITLRSPEEPTRFEHFSTVE